MILTLLYTQVVEYKLVVQVKARERNFLSGNTMCHDFLCHL